MKQVNIKQLKLDVLKAETALISAQHEIKTGLAYDTLQAPPPPGTIPKSTPIDPDNPPKILA